MGDLLDQMVVVASTRMTRLPPRLEVARLREAAQLPQRAHLAALAHRIAAFADGMRAMEKCAPAICHLNIAGHDLSKRPALMDSSLSPTKDEPHDIMLRSSKATQSIQDAA